MAKVMQGTTPSLRIRIKTDEFYVTDVTAAEVYIRNAGATKTYKLDDLTVDAENNAFYKHFSEEETAAYIPRKSLIVQARFWLTDGNIVGINKTFFEVDDMMEVGVDG